jgi:uncharacterized membrane-anchored protein
MRSATLIGTLILSLVLRAQDRSAEEQSDPAWDEAEDTLNADSLIAAFQWQSGIVRFNDSVASLELAPSHKFLHADQAYHLLVDVWKNPPELTTDLLGVVLQADAGVYDDRPAYLIYHEWAGYVSDQDAGAIDYDAKLKAMMADDSLDNARRRELGYSGLQLIGWALPPFYDRQAKALHWAKEMVSDREERNVLNYNVKLLGRHGVLTVNAITTMDHLDEVRDELPVVLGMLSFNDGYRYDQFDPRTDQAAERSLGGLIDGVEPDRMLERIVLGLKAAVGAFLGALALLIALWFLIVRKKR